MIADLRLPLPLLNPEAWPDGDELLILAGNIGWGGAFEQRVARAKSITVQAPDEFWSDPSSVFVKERAEEFKTKFKVLLEFASVPKGDLPSLADYAQAIFPETYAKWPELTQRRIIESYKKEIDSKFDFVSELTYFVGFLRKALGAQALQALEQTQDEVLELAALEWAKFAVFSSPQNESQGSGDDVILNPTLEIPPSLDKNSHSLRALFRVNGEVREQFLGWQEASVIDELHETGRMKTDHLLSELENKTFVLHKSLSFEKVLERLMLWGILLKREST